MVAEGSRERAEDSWQVGEQSMRGGSQSMAWRRPVHGGRQLTGDGLRAVRNERQPTKSS